MGSPRRPEAEVQACQALGCVSAHPGTDDAAAAYLLHLDRQPAKVAQHDLAAGLRQRLAPDLDAHCQHLLDLPLGQVREAAAPPRGSAACGSSCLHSGVNLHRFSPADTIRTGCAPWSRQGLVLSRPAVRRVLRTAEPVQPPGGAARSPPAVEEPAI
ncbi:MAG: hypothetical protein IPK19_11480 [Chloroflexi bacterium]|nr:hypothetical protein [Chloroflexota bacterium]